MKANKKRIIFQMNNNNNNHDNSNHDLNSNSSSIDEDDLSNSPPQFKRDNDEHTENINTNGKFYS